LELFKLLFKLLLALTLGLLLLHPLLPMLLLRAKPVVAPLPASLLFTPIPALPTPTPPTLAFK